MNNINNNNNNNISVNKTKKRSIATGSRHTHSIRSRGNRVSRPPTNIGLSAPTTSTSSNQSRAPNKTRTILDSNLNINKISDTQSMDTINIVASTYLTSRQDFGALQATITSALANYAKQMSKDNKTKRRKKHKVSITWEFEC